MSMSRMQALPLVTGCAVLFAATAAAQSFAAPKRIKAGDAYLGEGRLYPSPVLHDVDGDQRVDIVIGDLFGRVTFAPRAASNEAVLFGAEKQLKDRSGEQLKFHNW